MASPQGATPSQGFLDLNADISQLAQKREKEARMRANYTLGKSLGYRQKIANTVEFRFFPSIHEFQNMLTRAYVDDYRGRQIWKAIKVLPKMEDIVNVPPGILWEILRSGVMFGTDQDSMQCCHAVVTWAWSQDARLVAMLKEDLVELLKPDAGLPLLNLSLMLNGIAVGLENDVILHFSADKCDFQNTLVQQLMPEETDLDLVLALCEFLIRIVLETPDILNCCQDGSPAEKSVKMQYQWNLVKAITCCLNVCIETSCDCVVAAGRIGWLLVPLYVSLNSLEMKRKFIYLIVSISPLLCFAVCLHVLDKKDPRGHLWNKSFPMTIADVFLGFILSKPELEMQSSSAGCEVFVALSDEDLMLLYWALRSYRNSRMDRLHLPLQKRLKVKDTWSRNESTCRLIGQAMPKLSRSAIGASKRSENYIFNIKQLLREYVLGGIPTSGQQ